ncbi:MAG: flagellar hook-basal body complex protein FliE [Solirubrobacterales bacterium]|nr:flagellar hook-basal body complex protein FliE [Solirubrobacterales bacterium]
MAIPAIDPSFLTRGAEWSVDVGGATEAQPGGGSFGSALSSQISKLEGLQNEAADAARSIADGTATDPATAVVAVERAQLAMQLAAQLRTKGVEAINDVMRTQV